MIRDPSGVPVDTGNVNHEARATPKDWVEREVNPYDANRYDPEKDNDRCLVCDTPFEGEYWPRAGGEERCPTCEVTVMYLD